MGFTLEKSVNVIDEKGDIVWHRKFDQKMFDRLLRLFELLPDEESLNTLDKVIKELESPKLELAQRIGERVAKNGKLQGFLVEALTALPMGQLREMNKRLSNLKMKREPGGDCLIIEGGEKPQRINL